MEAEDIINCRQIVKAFLADPSNKAKIELKDFLLITECFNQIKNLYKDLESRAGDMTESKVIIKENPEKVKELEYINDKLTEEIEKMKAMVNQREEEMKLLVNLLEKQRAKDTTLLHKLEKEENEFGTIKNNLFGEAIPFKKVVDETTVSRIKPNESLEMMQRSEVRMNDTKMSRRNMAPADLLQQLNKASSVLEKEVAITTDLLADKLVAYDMFKKRHMKIALRDKNDADYKELILKGKAAATQYSALKPEKEEDEKELKKIIFQKSYIKEDNEAMDKMKELEKEVYERLSKKNDMLKEFYKIMTNVKKETARIERMNQGLMEDIKNDFETWFDLARKRVEYD